MIQLLEALQY